MKVIKIITVIFITFIYILALWAAVIIEKAPHIVALGVLTAILILTIQSIIESM